MMFHPLRAKPPLRRPTALLGALLACVSLLLGTSSVFAETSLDPQALYGACAEGGFGKTGSIAKSNHVLSVGRSLQNVVAIDVLDCHFFDGPGDTFVVDCPPDAPYTYCLLNENDGLGNSIRLGVLERAPEIADPQGVYGRCGPGAGTRRKAEHVIEVGKTLDNVVAIDVLDCHFFDGPGGTRIVGCPAGIRYTYCLLNENDGLGNHVALGVIEKTPSVADPNGVYGGCQIGSGFRHKSEHVLAVGRNLAPVTAIYVLVCAHTEDQAGTFVVPCPPWAFNPYTYCLQNQNDGAGNAILLGVVEGRSDTVAPTTTVAASPAANAAGWNRTDVTATLTASDNPGGSGIKQVTFSASGAQTIAATSMPGATASLPRITAEGVTTLTFFATDEAGNKEPAKTLVIKIDKTPPEATARFDPALHDLVVVGRDSGSGVSNQAVAPLSAVAAPVARDEDEHDAGSRGERRAYRIVDAAGNTLQLEVDVRKAKDQLRAQLVSLQYNQGAVRSVADNRARFKWQARELEQKLQLADGGRQTAEAKFDAEKNQTRIDIKGHSGERKLTRSGLVLLELVTSRGELSIAF